MLRRTKLVTAVLMASGLLIGASGSAMAADREDPTPVATTAPSRGVTATPETTAAPSRDVSATPETTVEPGVRETPATEATPGYDEPITSTPGPTVDTRDRKAAEPARPVLADPSFTG